MLFKSRQLAGDFGALHRGATTEVKFFAAVAQSLCAVAFIPLARRLPLKPARMDRKNIAGWLLPLFLVFVPLMVFLCVRNQ